MVAALKTYIWLNMRRLSRSLVQSLILPLGFMAAGLALIGLHLPPQHSAMLAMPLFLVLLIFGTSLLGHSLYQEDARDGTLLWLKQQGVPLEWLVFITTLFLWGQVVVLVLLSLPLTVLIGLPPDTWGTLFLLSLPLLLCFSSLLSLLSALQLAGRHQGWLSFILLFPLIAPALLWTSAALNSESLWSAPYALVWGQGLALLAVAPWIGRFGLATALEQ